VRNALLYITILLIAVFGGAPHARAAGKAARKPAATDREIEQKIQAKLAKSKLAVDHFSVFVAHGVVTVAGVTDVPQHKGVMTRMAKAAGAVAVRNNIRVSAAGKAKTTAALAKARAKHRRVSTRTGTDAKGPRSPGSSQIPHAKVLPPNPEKSRPISEVDNK
jgi:hypothetical protein